MGVKQVYLLSASSTNHKDIDEIIEFCENEGLIPLIEPTGIDKITEKIIATIAKYRDFFTLVADGSSERIRNKFGKRISDEDIINTAMRVHEDYGIHRFHFYQIINFYGEQEEDRLNIANIINRIRHIIDDVQISLYINPVFPSANTPYERFKMEHPHETFRRINRILNQIKGIEFNDINLVNYYFENKKSNNNFGSMFKLCLHWTNLWKGLL